MSRNDEGDDLCPACGKPIPPTRHKACSCTAADLRDIFARDRAEMSRRLAASEVRANELRRLENSRCLAVLAQLRDMQTDEPRRRALEQAMDLVRSDP